MTERRERRASRLAAAVLLVAACENPTDRLLHLQTEATMLAGVNAAAAYRADSIAGVISRLPADAPSSERARMESDRSFFLAQALATYDTLRHVTAEMRLLTAGR
jgi:hypothetical protein